MADVLLFVKDFELGSRLSEACVDGGTEVEFSDETTNPDDFSENCVLAIVDMEVKVFASVGLISALKRHGIKVIGMMGKVSKKEQSKLRSAGCDIILPRSSIVRNIPNLLNELLG